MLEVAIVGGGPGGLMTAWQVRKKMQGLCRVTLFEASERLGGKIVWRGAFELMLVGPQEERWDHCFIAEYPSVEAFAALFRDPVYREAMQHRLAAVRDCRLVRYGASVAGSRFSNA